MYTMLMPRVSQEKEHEQENIKKKKKNSRQTGRHTIIERVNQPFDVVLASHSTLNRHISIICYK